MKSQSHIPPSRQHITILLPAVGLPEVRLRAAKRPRPFPRLRLPSSLTGSDQGRPAAPLHPRLLPFFSLFPGEATPPGPFISHWRPLIGRLPPGMERSLPALDLDWPRRSRVPANEPAGRQIQKPGQKDEAETDSRGGVWPVRGPGRPPESPTPTPVRGEGAARGGRELPPPPRPWRLQQYQHPQEEEVRGAGRGRSSAAVEVGNRVPARKEEVAVQ